MAVSSQSSANATSQQKRQGFRKTLFSKACDFIAKSLEEAEAAASQRQLSAQSATTSISSPPTLPARRTTPTISQFQPSFPARIGDPATWNTVRNGDFSFRVPASALSNGPTSENQYSFSAAAYPGSEMIIGVYPMYSRDTCDDYIQRQSGNLPNRAMIWQYYMSTFPDPILDQTAVSAATHTATMHLHRKDYTDGIPGHIYTVILRPSDLTGLGLRIQVEGLSTTESSSTARSIALEIGRTISFSNTSNPHNQAIGVYARSNKEGFSNYYSSTIANFRTKLWLFGDGIYILDKHDKMEHSAFLSLGGRSWDRARETGCWTIEGFASQKVKLIKADDGVVKEWSFQGPTGNGRQSIDWIMEFERKVRAREYWDIVSYGETHGGGSAAQLNTCD
ncbi:hypothetical protein LTR56_021545 [Elasticomyces elasticus]|nr:hypothetical protein LTR56_021545 [Elasticomyces elasticus]KAK3631283.1 hypothetical protein LTR22_021167 [Elasticomyces elasticus]KAK4909335.1 hypothetical protein LTR49_021847 [Elasticomyces elasticus]KAK5749363.1 hypothetical protein LTS12_020544 [Elasticomyces elasticus]